MTTATHSPTTTAASVSGVATALKSLLADSYALMAQSHLAHWNVEGPAFFQLHAAFQAQYEELFQAVDEIAERLRALDVLAPGGLATLASLSKVSEFGVAPAPAKDFVAHLIEGHEQAAASARAVRDVAEHARDLETQDLAIGRLQGHQKTLWMLRSFLKNL
jgi:starvation-inducible DNA-binding protein